MKKLTAKHAGFTLVELLIVIVVIAILAAITIVAYNGIQQRAYNTRIVQGVAQYETALESYKAINGEYPKTSREQAGEHISLTCLGTGYPDNTCGTVTGVEVSEDGVFNTAMQTILASSPPALGDNLIHVDGESFAGAVYGGDDTTHSSTHYARTIQYALLGKDQDCVLSGAWAYNTTTSPATTACEIDLEEMPQP